MLTVNVEGHTLLPCMTPEDVVLDLGANVGRFSHAIIRRYGCRSVAVEASPTVLRTIPADPRLRTLNYAVSATNAPVQFSESANSEASAVVRDGVCVGGTPFTVEGRTIETLCEIAGVARVAVMKLDIEGSEIAALNACSDDFLRRTGQITVEFHDFCGLTPRADILAVAGRLRRLGFFEIRMSRTSYIDTLFVNRDDPGMTRAQFLYVRYLERNWVGLKRMIDRALG